MPPPPSPPPPTRSRPSFEHSTRIHQLTPHTYTATFPQSWCIGSVPNGGFIAACFLRVASTHFASTLAAQNQPHTTTLHLTFLRRTSVGPALFTVRDVKLGRQTSTIHITLSQGHGQKEKEKEKEREEQREEVVGYLTHSNLSTETGPSFNTHWTLHPAPLPATPSLFNANTDPNWIRLDDATLPFSDFRPAFHNLQWLVSRDANTPSTPFAAADRWVGMATRHDGKLERFTNATVGFVIDMFPQVVELIRNPNVYRPEGVGKGVKSAGFWYPTVLLNLEVKKALPDEGVDWLFLRVRAKVIKNGRYDLEVVVLDETGDVVALSHHVVLVVPVARNTAQRSKKQDTKI